MKGQEPLFVFKCLQLIASEVTAASCHETVCLQSFDSQLRWDDKVLGPSDALLYLPTAVVI